MIMGIRTMTKRIEKMATASAFVRLFFGAYYEKSLRREIMLGQITADDRVLFIGGGSLPWSAIKIAEYTGASVCVIDMDCEAVEKAKEVIAGLGLSHRIDVRCGFGEEADASGYSVVHVAVQVFSRRKILARIMATAKEGTRVLLRCPGHKVDGVCCHKAEPCLCNSCDFGIRFLQSPNKTLLFIKKGKDNHYEDAEDREKFFTGNVRLDYHRSLTAK